VAPIPRVRDGVPDIGALHLEPDPVAHRDDDEYVNVINRRERGRCDLCPGRAAILCSEDPVAVGDDESLGPSIPIWYSACIADLGRAFALRPRQQRQIIQQDADRQKNPAQLKSPHQMYGAFFLTGVAIVLALATTGTATIGGLSAVQRLKRQSE